MRSLKASEVVDYLGKDVRVVYSVREANNTGQAVFVFGADITGPVKLLKYDSSLQEVEIQRSNGQIQTFKPIAVLVDV